MEPQIKHLQAQDKIQTFAELSENGWEYDEAEVLHEPITEANDLIAPIHPRMPMILPEDQYGLWFEPAMHDKNVLIPLLKPYPSNELEHYTVTPKVNSFKYDDPENIRPLSMETINKEKENRRAK